MLCLRCLLWGSQGWISFFSSWALRGNWTKSCNWSKSCNLVFWVLSCTSHPHFTCTVWRSYDFLLRLLPSTKSCIAIYMSLPFFDFSSYSSLLILPCASQKKLLSIGPELLRICRFHLWLYLADFGSFSFSLGGRGFSFLRLHLWSLQCYPFFTL